jgi:hypothetical protein
MLSSTHVLIIISHLQFLWESEKFCDDVVADPRKLFILVYKTWRCISKNGFTHLHIAFPSKDKFRGYAQFASYEYQGIIRNYAKEQ